MCRTALLGIAGYSQGGAGAIRAVTECENSGLYKTIFTGSAAHSYLAQMWGGYDASKVSIPWFMTAATGNSDDTGASDATKEWLGVAPLSSLVENYNAMSDSMTFTSLLCSIPTPLQLSKLRKLPALFC